MRGQAALEPLARREQLTSLPFDQRHVKAVIDSDPGPGGKLVGPWQERQVGMQSGEYGDHTAEMRLPFSGRDSTLPFSLRQRMRDFDGEDIGCDQVVHLTLEVVPDANRLVGVGFRQKPLESDIR